MPDARDGAIRADAVAPVRERARLAARGPEGEPARRELRALAGPYLSAATADVDDEIRRLARRLDPPADGFYLALAGANGREAREELSRRWFAAEARMEPLRRDRFEARSAAARAAGAACTTDFLGSVHPVEPATLIDPFERGAIAPLDSAIAEFCRSSRASDAPALETLAEHRDSNPGRGASRVLDEISTKLGEDPDGSGPRVKTPPWGGPAALGSGLESLGRALRGTVLSRVRGSSAASSTDPAFAIAAGRLFARLAISRRFLSWAGFEEPTRWLDDLRFEDAVFPRLGWAFLSIATRTEAEPVEEHGRLLRRASGREPTPGLLARIWESDPMGASVLRGVVLAVLLEERILSRFGTLWFVDRAAGRFLKDLWVAEPDETAESMIRALGLGTMEPTPILDACRPVGSEARS